MLDSYVIRLHENDNVVVARKKIDAGCFIREENVTAKGDIPYGFKLAVKSIAKGEPVVKYNTVIGYAGRDIEPGERMHTDNILLAESDTQYDFCKNYKPTPQDLSATFKGIVRENGKVGTRNYIGVFAMSNCAATVVRKITGRFSAEYMKQYPNIDGVVPFNISSGCGMENGEPLDYLRRTIHGYMEHANIAGFVAVSLGCERNNINDFFRLYPVSDKPFTCITIQEDGGTRKSVEKGIAAVEEMLPAANRYVRQEVSAEHLTVALECGGSDSFSGLSANPALGVAMTKLIRCGGTAVLAEISEIFGAEHILTKRAVTPEIGQKLIDRIHWWQQYAKGRDIQLNGVVTPGNAAGGITNVLEKSLGGIKKGGESGLMEVYLYGQQIKEKGLVFMDTPGYDPVAVTGQIAGGCNLVAFTTGRGSCFGSYPIPTYKLATNTPMYNALEEDMDINCGSIIDGEESIEAVGERIFEDILRYASGEKTKSEMLGVGGDEFQPWNIGVYS